MHLRLETACCIRDRRNGLAGCANTRGEQFPEGTYITDIATADVPADAQPASIRSLFPGHFKITFSSGRYTMW
jgi:hypothetical protein